MCRVSGSLIALFLVVTFSRGQSPNILNNGGFEYGLMCYGKAVWSNTGKDYKGDYKFQLSSDVHSGEHSLEINCGGPDCLKAAIISDLIPAIPGQTYALSLYAKCPEGRDAALYVPGTAGGNVFRPLTCTDRWVSNEVSFTTRRDATRLTFYVYNRDTAWLRIDDVVLRAVGRMTSKAASSAGAEAVSQPAPQRPGPRKVSISGQTLVIDGKPYFARGFFDVTYDDLPLAAAADANTVSAVGHTMSDACFNSPGVAYQDRAYELGLNMVPSSSSAAALNAPAVFPKIMARFANHAGNIGWFLADEPDQELVHYNYIPPTSLVGEYQAAKPGTSLPIMSDFQHASWDTADALRPYADAVDIWMAEPYGPDFSRVNHAIDTFNSVKRQPIWLAQDNPETGLIVPKAYWTVIGGATGIIYFNWEYFKANPAKMAAATQAFAELRQLNDVIFAANVDSRVTPPAGIGAMARDLNGSVHIMAVNPKPDVVQGHFQVPGLEAGTPITVLFENRVVTAESGGFSDMFSGVSRHVYRLPAHP